jgi:hypothetical protein
MRAKDCNEIRRKIEETDPGQNPGALTMSHVRQCDGCLEFFEQDMKLRQLVASLSPVEAPADFDFRLRARIANERVSARRGFTIGTLSLGIPTVTFAGLVLLAALFVLLPRLRSTEEPIRITASPDKNDMRAVDTVPAPTVAGGVDEAIHLTGGRPKQSRKPNPGGRKQTLAFQRADGLEVRDLSAVGARVVRQEDSVIGSQIPLSFPLQTLTVSVDDGTGVSRTISFPTVSFGSQRVLTNARSGSNPSVKGIW